MRGGTPSPLMLRTHRPTPAPAPHTGPQRRRLVPAGGRTGARQLGRAEEPKDLGDSGQSSEHSRAVHRSAALSRRQKLTRPLGSALTVLFTKISARPSQCRGWCQAQSQGVQAWAVTYLVSLALVLDGHAGLPDQLTVRARHGLQQERTRGPAPEGGPAWEALAPEAISVPEAQDGGSDWGSSTQQLLSARLPRGPARPCCRPGAHSDTSQPPFPDFRPPAQMAPSFIPPHRL